MAPPFQLHNNLIRNHKYVGFPIVFSGSVILTALTGWYYYLVFKAERDYFKNYDAYKHYEIMCRAQLERGKVHMRTCPHEMAKKWQANGRPIAPLDKSQ